MVHVVSYNCTSTAKTHHSHKRTSVTNVISCVLAASALHAMHINSARVDLRMIVGWEKSVVRRWLVGFYCLCVLLFELYCDTVRRPPLVLCIRSASARVALFKVAWGLLCNSSFRSTSSPHILLANVSGSYSMHFAPPSNTDDSRQTQMCTNKHALPCERCSSSLIRHHSCL